MNLLALFGYTKADRDAMPAEDFAGPDQSFPIKVKADVAKAWDLAGHADDPDAVREKIKAIARRKGWEDELPKTAKMSALDMSVANIQASLQAALGTDPDGDGDEDYPWVVDVFLGKSLFVYGCDGLLYEQAFNMDDDGTVTLVGSPRQVRTATSYEPVAKFSAESDGSVFYEGEIFAAGDYPDKGVKATPSSLVALAAGFNGLAPADIEHMPTAFDGALAGYGLQEVRAVDGGAKLWGKIALPSWVREALGTAIKPSLTLRYDSDGRPTSIDKIAIVGNPRISSARMQAAFTAAFAGARHSAGDMKALQDAHDLLVGLGATCQPTAQMSGSRPAQTTGPSVSAHGQGVRMNPFQKALAFFRGKPEAQTEAGITGEELATFAAAAGPTIDPTVQAELDKLAQKNVQLEAQFAARDAILLETRAAEFADQIIERERKAVPAERPGIIHAFKLAANADGKGVATFAADGAVVEGENLRTVKALFSNRKPLALFGDQLPDSVNPDVESTLKTRQYLVTGAIDAYNRRAN